VHRRPPDKPDRCADGQRGANGAENAVPHDHNYNVIPLRKRGGEQRYVLVSGNYMSGISVVDITNPANAKEIAYADQPAFPNGFESGDWSTYCRRTGTTATSSSRISSAGSSHGGSTIRA
jgi:hypothetical protein